MCKCIVFSIKSHLVLESRNHELCFMLQGDIKWTGLLVKFHQFCFVGGLFQQNQHRNLSTKVNTIFGEISSSDGFLPLLSSHTFCLRFCGKNELCHFTLWHSSGVEQTIYSLSVKNYSKVNTIIFSSASLASADFFFFFYPLVLQIF